MQTENYYIDNKEFTQAVADYAAAVTEDRAAGKEPRPVTNYIAECFLKLAYGLARSGNFMNYSYKEDMVMDAVENCIKVVSNFDDKAATRSGKPNAFGYFTQIAYFAFLRRIGKEKKQSDIKQRLIDSSDIDIFADFGSNDNNQMGENIVERIRNNSTFYNDSLGEESLEIEKPKRKRGRPAKKPVEFGPLSDFLNSEEEQ